jgi:hypothetical protein
MLSVMGLLVLLIACQHCRSGVGARVARRGFAVRLALGATRMRMSG